MWIFKVPPTLAGMKALTQRLRPYAGSLVVAEPTGGTWLPLSVAVGDAGCRIGFVANRDSARLRKAISGANKTVAIDADMLANCQRVLGVMEAPAVSFGQIGLRRALRRRHSAVVAAHRVECRLWALSAWAFPDVWRACGGHRVAQPVLRRWAHLGSLSRAHVDSIADIVALHSRDKRPERRAVRIRDAAGWLVAILGRPARRRRLGVGGVGAARRHRRCRCRHCPLLRARLGVVAAVLARRRVVLHPRHRTHVRRLDQGVVGNREPSSVGQGGRRVRGSQPVQLGVGLSASPSRPITKQGPAELRLAYYQAANIARRHDPELADFYRRLMVNRGHNHIKANTAVAPQTGLPGLGGPADRPALPAARPRRRKDRPAQRHCHRRDAGRA